MAQIAHRAWAWPWAGAGVLRATGNVLQWLVGWGMQGWWWYQGQILALCQTMGKGRRRISLGRGGN